MLYKGIYVHLPFNRSNSKLHFLHYTLYIPLPQTRLCRYFCLHLPPRRKDHILPPPLQQRLSLAFIRAPRSARLRLRFFGLRGVDFGREVVPCYEVGLEGFGWCWNAGGRGGDGNWGLERLWWLHVRLASVQDRLLGLGGSRIDSRLPDLSHSISFPLSPLRSRRSAVNPT